MATPEVQRIFSIQNISIISDDCEITDPNMLQNAMYVTVFFLGLHVHDYYNHN